MPLDAHHTPESLHRLHQHDALTQLQQLRGTAIYLARAAGPATRTAAQHLVDELRAAEARLRAALAEDGAL